mmetsp:Transcript_2106/g.6892  ORF Transcript_2106/g.6892 Transcript_2106/m.6892 type:complete len:443 (+) Transcript_2106:1706-3034(+)
MGGAHRIQLERLPLHVGDELFPHGPFRVQLGADASLHPSGEALVEPQVVPPLHRDQVAEPLVGQFVNHNLGHALQLPGGGAPVVDQQVHLAVRHQAPVLHRASRKLRDGHHVRFWQRVPNLEGVVVRVERRHRALEREAAEVRLARRAKDADQHAVLADLGQVVELAHHKGEQVGGHARRGHEGDRLGPVAVVVHHRLGHVGERHHVRRHAQRAGEGGLAARLVPAGKAPPRVDRLELGGGHQLLLTVDVGVGRAIEATHLVVELTRVGDRQAPFAAREGGAEAEGGRAGLVVGDRRDGFAHAFEGRRYDGKVLGVEGDGFDVIGGHDDVDHNLTVKCVVLKAQCEREIVGIRLNFWREHNAAGVWSWLDMGGAALPAAAAHHGETTDGLIHIKVDEPHRLGRRRWHVAGLAQLQWVRLASDAHSGLGLHVGPALVSSAECA